jgi:rhodanese-related sulfurtransferase
MARFDALSPADFATAVAARPAPFVVDVRDAAEYEKGHVPGSRSIPVHEIGHRRAEFPHQKIARILVVGEGAKRTQAAAAWLVLMGFADVGVLDGGFAAWTGPVEKGPPPPPPARGPQLRVIQ